MRYIFHFLIPIFTAVLSRVGYLGIISLMAIESACVPVPSELIMPMAGFGVSQGRFTLLGVATAGALGTNIGSAVAYWLGALGGRRFISRYGRYLFLDEEDLTRVERFFHRFGSSSVLLGRLMPFVRTFIAFPAGMSRMPQIRFHLLTFCGSWVWCIALAYAGEKTGSLWLTDTNQFMEILHIVNYVILVVVAGAVVVFLLRRWLKTRAY